ncbi:MAG TPA: GNAT family N-acetyltransferase [Herpetosiphonaceae bacterium]|nr:GNAT family N-acetyltransferase [Herpetosiphonaceae bacterium]
MIRPAVPADAAAIAHVHVAAWRTTYPGLMPQHIIDSRSEEAMTDRWSASLASGRGVALVAEIDGRVVGFVDGGAERTGDYPPHDGEIYSLYVLKEFQGRGLGRELVAAMAGLLAPQFNGLLIWVLKGNPAQRFYEALGGTYLIEKSVEFHDTTIQEIAYGWRDWSLVASR